MNAIEEFEAQPELAPGDEGWWKVWGASTADVRVGDIVICEFDGVTYTKEIVQDRGDQIVGRQLTDAEGNKFMLGALQPIVLVRKGTQNTLADSV